MMTIDPLLLLVTDVLLGALFLAGGMTKTRDPAGFTGTLGDYRLLPDALVRPAVVAIVVGELAAGAATLLALPVGSQAGSQAGRAAIAALLLLYAGAMGVNLARGRAHIDCGCLGFGATRATLRWDMVARNMLLAALALAAAVLPASARSIGAIDWISATGAVAALALLHQAFGQFGAVRARQAAR